MKKLKIGVIGVGYWGKKIVEEYTELSKGNEGVSVESVCDLNEENLKYCKERFGIANVYHDYSELLSIPEIDAVNICTSNETHYRICKDALNANKHVLLEKPMTLKSSEAYELVRLAEKKGLTLSVGHIFRFNNALRKVRELLKEGFFGDLYYLDLQWTTLFNAQNRDIITDLAPHPFDILNFLTDMWPERITCVAKGYRDHKREEIAFISSEFENRIMGHMHLSWLMPGKTRLVRVSGSKNAAEIDCLSQEVNVSDGQKRYSLDVNENNTIRSELEYFLECIRNSSSGREYTNNNDGIVGARVVELLEASKRSIEQSKTVSVDSLEV